MLHDLPLELTDRIIDYLSDDHASLRSCSLTSHAWLPRSRFHLFSNMHVEENERLGSLVDVSYSNGAPPLDLVRSLTFKGIYWNPPWTGRLADIFGNSSSSLQAFIAQQTESRYAGILVSTLRQFRNVTRLDLSGCTFRNLEMFRDIISAFPLLRRLCLQCVLMWDRVSPSDDEVESDYPLSRPWTSCPPLTHISLVSRMRSMWSVYQYIVSTTSPQSVRSLELAVPRSGLDYAGSSIEVVAPHLERLKVEPEEEFILAEWRLLNLNNCSALRTFSMANTGGVPLAEILRFLSPCCRVRVLYLRLHAIEERWEDLREVVTSEQFSELREVTMTLGDVYESPGSSIQCVNEFAEFLERRGVRTAVVGRESRFLRSSNTLGI
ncbi:hypothetical protein SCP_0201440 [Sparassis crispa]|uniref:F-box domain-containing protein n=1 Tax=Sparassis crispa TaxID=139825 RepID=A0A401G9W7_9APHY|nr:hypothetical protein SCP_0201440 [Sparassis crispa]GBE78947.1 hypothetical protein SCP_0201440 [Sparassis crispa]